MASRALPLSLFALMTLFPAAHAWGAMGHETIAYIASDFVSPATQSYFQSLLSDSSSDYLASVSTWADSYRYTAGGSFSAPFHYIDAQDDPPSSCDVDFERDCGEEGCVVSAIANYTAQLLKPELDIDQRQIAAKMIIHFVGDIGQPLHCENLALGGNDIDVKYAGKSTNLHSVWDTQIPTAIAGGSTVVTARAWATNLTAEIKSGTYKCAARAWSRDMNVTDAQNVALGWARESNTYVCTTVLAEGLAYVESTDLSGSYTTDATPVVDLQIAKQGYRLAKWLDAIVAAI